MLLLSDLDVDALFEVLSDLLSLSSWLRESISL